MVAFQVSMCGFEVKAISGSMDPVLNCELSSSLSEVPLIQQSCLLFRLFFKLYYDFRPQI